MKKILIVEDQALVRMYLCSSVEKSGECEVAGVLRVQMQHLLDVVRGISI